MTAVNPNDSGLSGLGKGIQGATYDNDRAPVTLYDLSRGMREIEAFIDEHQDEIIAAGGDLDAVPGLREQLDAIEGKFTDKVERVALFIQNRAGLEGIRRQESERFKRLADADKRVVESLKTYLVRCQRMAGQLKVETPAVRSSVQRNSVQSIERLATASPLKAVFESTLLDSTDPAGVLSCITVSTPEPVYSLNRDRILEIWKAEYERQKSEIAANPRIASLSDYELDEFAQEMANGHPALLALGVTVSQGFHVRLR